MTCDRCGHQAPIDSIYQSANSTVAVRLCYLCATILDQLVRKSEGPR